MEAIGDGLRGWRVDPEPGGDIGERKPGGVQLGRMREGVVVPGRSFLVSWNVVAVEVGGDGGAMDAVQGGELADGGAGSVGGDEVVDVGGGEASLGGV